MVEVTWFLIGVVTALWVLKDQVVVVSYRPNANLDKREHDSWQRIFLQLKKHNIHQDDNTELSNAIYNWGVSIYLQQTYVVKGNNINGCI